MSLKAIGLYAFLVLAVSWCLQFVVLTFWGLDHEMTMPALVAVMWSPTLIALAFIMMHPAARRGVLWRLGRLAYLPFGITVETLIGLAVVGILVAAGMASSGWFGFGGSAFTVHPEKEVSFGFAVTFFNTFVMMNPISRRLSNTVIACQAAVEGSGRQPAVMARD